MGLIRNLLDRNFFPDNDWTRDKNGDPIRPYDLSTDNVAEFMGVRVDHVAGPLNVEDQTHHRSSDHAWQSSSRLVRLSPQRQDWTPPTKPSTSSRPKASPLAESSSQSKEPPSATSSSPKVRRPI